MAFLVKNAPVRHRGPDGNPPTLCQTVRVERAAAALPQTTTTSIFQVRNGRVLVKALFAEVTTAVQAQANNLSVVVDSDAGAADDIASAVDINGIGLGTVVAVEGDGTAAVIAGIGWGTAALAGSGSVILPGLIRVTTSASSTGALRWTLLYQPIDEAADVVAV